MTIMQDVNNIQFRVETFMVKDRRNGKTVRADQEGYYTLPVAVLGTVSQNNTYYDVESFAKQMTSPDTFINKVLTQGKLYGEFGHPRIAGLSNELSLERLAVVEEKSISHHIRDISTGASLPNGGKLVLASIKPTGPYKQALQDSIDDPCINTAFSLRAITSAEPRGQVSYRVMKKLVTFDAVAAGGYSEAAKSYAPGLESFDVSIDSTGRVTLSQVSMENFTDTELNELFGINSIGKVNQVNTILSKQASYEFRSSLGNRSFYMDLIRE